MILRDGGHVRESSALADVLEICRQPKDFGGLEISEKASLTAAQESEIVFLVAAWLEALNSSDRAMSISAPLDNRPAGRRGMTLSEKIFALHDMEQKGSVAPGDLIRTHVDWVVASELSWMGMERTYHSLGSPGIFRNDRFWLAGDHVVDPRINNSPKAQAMIDASERAKRVFKMTDYQGMNYTILHTEFYRERAQPGMLVIGSDSHTCSSGAVGCLAIGLGVADVTMPLVTGETWFKVPESVNIRMVGRPRPGIGGKDIILYILKQLKRNTVTSDRVVEFTGPGAEHLSSDARFAICNMTTMPKEFGGITGLFTPDQTTFDFIQKRKLSRHKDLKTYFQPDEDAQYAETHEINLDDVRSFMARYPNPDDVVPVPELEGMSLDGCFIGACTTTEEDLILGALVLGEGLQRGLKPATKGKRKVVPGSLPILNRLQELGLTQIYEDAGFEIGVPGCSYCVGISADAAAPGEVWLSSQNRNFKNRMGRGSIGHLGSAATVAASSFTMTVTDPHDLLASIDEKAFRDMIKTKRGKNASKLDPSTHELRYVEPPGNPKAGQDIQSTEDGTAGLNDENLELKGKAQVLGDFIDTDALAPGPFLTEMIDNASSGLHCLELTHPEFRERARSGFSIVVAGKGFGCGSSRENAVMALLGCGVKCVIAKSFSFIFQRNMPNLGLLGITLSDESFFSNVSDGADISIDFHQRTINLGDRVFPFTLSKMEQELFEHGGIESAFRHFGRRLFEVMTSSAKGVKAPDDTAPSLDVELQW
ncbi:hypothetical protein N7468_004882 [Penicillium chermesinum]|uniref:Aconitase family protein n=1 Tax=Penicillium chermesinum TaxID=63820 RepID=A0A9W9TTN3_9EURO|nr:uncharacterized protein N7468_004882 [Penicillium chermesinum]KAJ5240263.1 hypothetical protein N7468_004882 [Penicillium chermesinum]